MFDDCDALNPDAEESADLIRAQMSPPRRQDAAGSVTIRNCAGDWLGNALHEVLDRDRQIDADNAHAGGCIQW